MDVSRDQDSSFCRFRSVFVHPQKHQHARFRSRSPPGILPQARCLAWVPRRRPGRVAPRSRPWPCQQDLGQRSWASRQLHTGLTFLQQSGLRLEACPPQCRPQQCLRAGGVSPAAWGGNSGGRPGLLWPGAGKCGCPSQTTTHPRDRIPGRIWMTAPRAAVAPRGWPRPARAGRQWQRATCAAGRHGCGSCASS